MKTFKEPKIKPSDSEKMTWYRRGGQRLTREEVKKIKFGRKKLRYEMRAKGIKDKQEFEITAASLGLYFDKGGFPLFLWWLHGRGLWALLGAALLLLLSLTLVSFVSQMRGHFTINMSDGLFREGFSLSESKDFASPTSVLFAVPAVDVPCISISWLPEDLDTAYEGEHNQDYFAYTYFLRNEGENTVDYTWRVTLNSESRNLSDALWIMIFEDGRMTFYAKANALGQEECLPAKDVTDMGYSYIPCVSQLADPGKQLEVVAEKNGVSYYRVIPQKFVNDRVIATGSRSDIAPMEIHQYTVVIWLEGDDPDCSNDLIGGHAGLDMQFQLEGESSDPTGENESGVVDFFKDLWNSLKWW